LNVVFILADDLGWRDLGCYGRPDYETPVLDALAARGARLTQAYASSSSCSPTRVALLTGRYQQRLPVGLFDPLPPGSRVGLPEGIATLPRLLAAAGYRTGLVGKWHLGEGPGQGPLHHGYEEFFGFLGGAMTYFSHLSGPPGHAASRAALLDGESPVQARGYATALFADRAIEFIRRPDPRPFFLSLHFNAPHWPWEEPGGEAAAGNLREMWHYEGGSLRVYGAMVGAMDRAIGSVLAALQDSGKASETLVVFTSDNGGERYSFHWPLRGEKGSLWEGGIRVPAIVAGPGIAAGAVSDATAITMDWVPTILGYAGVESEPGGDFDGVDLGPALAGPGAGAERTLFWRTQDMAAARRGPWKYLRCGEDAYLVNLVEDITENANFRRTHPEVFAGLEQACREWDSRMLPIPAEGRRAPWDEIVRRKRRLV
jgi:arylsulfatase A-like enzyme